MELRRELQENSHLHYLFLFLLVCSAVWTARRRGEVGSKNLQVLFILLIVSNCISPFVRELAHSLCARISPKVCHLLPVPERKSPPVWLKGERGREKGGLF